MNKEDLRKHILRERRKLKEREVNILSSKILDNLRQLDIWNKSTFHSFLPIKRKKEVNTWPIIHYLMEELGKEVVLSKSDFKDISLRHFRYDSDTKLYLNKFGIQEPLRGITVAEKDIDVVFVPLLAVDNQGHRVGYGKGFYDRFLAKCPPETLRIGLSLFDELHPIDDIDATDIPLNACVTPNNLYRFNLQNSSSLTKF